MFHGRLCTRKQIELKVRQAENLPVRAELGHGLGFENEIVLL